MGWLDEYEAPHFTRKKRKDLTSFVVKLILIFVVIGGTYYYTSTSSNVVPQPENNQAAVSQPSSVASAPVFKSEAPNFDSHCTVVAGVVPGSILKDSNKVSFTFKNNGKGTIEGSYFEASNSNVKAYRKNSDALEQGKEITYSIDLDDVSKEVGVQVNSFIIYPIQGGNACLNQRMIVIG